MNRIFAVLVIVAVLALVGFGVLVFTSGGPPAPTLPGAQPRVASQPATPQPEAEPTVTTTSQGQAQPVAPATSSPPTAEEMQPETPEAADRFNVWAKTLRDDGLTVTAGRVAASGETISVAGLTIAGPDESPGWRWTAERASLYDRELFHLQTAGETEFVLTSGPGQETKWSGTADAIGIAITRDARDALGRSMIVRVNGLSISGANDSAPITLNDGQLRILLKGGTGLLTQGTDIVLRLSDLGLPAAAGSPLGSKLKSLSTEFAVDRAITSYSLQQVIDFFSRSGGAGVNLGTIALDWGPLDFIGTGTFGLGGSGAPRGRFDVKVADPLTLLDAVAAAGAVPAHLADTYAALLLEMGRNVEEGGVPMTVVFESGGLTIEGPQGQISVPLTAATPASAPTSAPVGATPTAAPANP